MKKYTIFVLRRMLIDAVVLGSVAVVMVWLARAQPFQRGFFCSDDSIKYPYRDNTISSDLLHYVGLILPAITIVALEVFALYNSSSSVQTPKVLGVPIPKWLRGCYSVLVAFGFGLLCTEAATNISKVSVGRLRPCFLDVCQPNINCSLAEYQNRYILPSEFRCIGGDHSAHALRDIRVSFMSGHSSWAAYTMVFLTLYLQKRLAWTGTRLPCRMLQFTALMLAFFTALSRVSDNKHHWSDVLFGFTTGAIFAIITARWIVQWVEPHEHALLPTRDTVAPPSDDTGKTDL